MSAQTQPLPGSILLHAVTRLQTIVDMIQVGQWYGKHNQVSPLQFDFDEIQII